MCRYSKAGAELSQVLSPMREWNRFRGIRYMIAKGVSWRT